MTVLGGELGDYSELDVAGLVEWQARAWGEYYADYAVRYVLGVLAPAADPVSIDLSGLGLMTATIPPVDARSDCGLRSHALPDLPTTSG